MHASLTLEAPLSRRLLAWAAERFPAGNAFGSAILVVGALAVGRGAASGPLSLGPLDALSLVAGVSFYLLLRVLDEHKDYDEDVANFPERVLSRGLVTLTHVKAVGVLCLFLQLGTALAADGGIGRVTTAWALVVGYALLMLREFFVPAWLKPRLVLYALSHVLVSPLATLWFYLVGVRGGSIGPELLWLGLLSYATMLTFEVTRKTLGPEEELPGVDSYSKRLGQRRAVVLIAAVLGVALAATVLLLRELGASTGAAFITASFFVPVAASLARFLRAPSAAARKRNEKLTKLALVACHLSPLVVVAAARGLAW
jgi:hypothetical protein